MVAKLESTLYNNLKGGSVLVSAFVSSLKSLVSEDS